jgi:hypothetical protein
MIDYDKIVNLGTLVKLRHNIVVFKHTGYGKFGGIITPKVAGTPVKIVSQFSNDIFNTLFEDGCSTIMVRPHLIFPEEEKADIVKAAINFYAEDTFTNGT